MIEGRFLFAKLKRGSRLRACSSYDLRSAAAAEPKQQDVERDLECKIGEAVGSAARTCPRSATKTRRRTQSRYRPYGLPASMLTGTAAMRTRIDCWTVKSEITISTKAPSAVEKITSAKVSARSRLISCLTAPRPSRSSLAAFTRSMQAAAAKRLFASCSIRRCADRS